MDFWIHPSLHQDVASAITLLQLPLSTASQPWAACSGFSHLKLQFKKTHCFTSCSPSCSPPFEVPWKSSRSAQCPTPLLVTTAVWLQLWPPVMRCRALVPLQSLSIYNPALHSSSSKPPIVQQLLHTQILLTSSHVHRHPCKGPDLASCFFSTPSPQSYHTVSQSGTMLPALAGQNHLGHSEMSLTHWHRGWMECITHSFKRPQLILMNNHTWGKPVLNYVQGDFQITSSNPAFWDLTSRINYLIDLFLPGHHKLNMYTWIHHFPCWTGWPPIAHHLLCWTINWGHSENISYSPLHQCAWHNGWWSIRVLRAVRKPQPYNDTNKIQSRHYKQYPNLERQKA